MRPSATSRLLEKLDYAPEAEVELELVGFKATNRVGNGFFMRSFVISGVDFQRHGGITVVRLSAHKTLMIAFRCVPCLRQL